MQLGRGSKTVLMLAATVVLFAGIKLAAPLLVPFLLAGFIAMVTAPLVFWLRGHKVPAGLAVLIAVLVDIAVLTGLGILVGQSLSDFYERLPQYQAGLEQAAVDATDWLAIYGVREEELTKTIDPGAVMGMVASLFRSITGVATNVVLVLLMVIFMLLEASGLRAKLTRIFGEGRDELERMRRAMGQVSKYMVVKTGTSAFTGVLVGVWCAVWGVDLPILWGLLAFMLNFIPQLGSIIAAVPPTAVALIQLGPGPALGVLAGYTVMNMFLGTVIEPRMFGRAVGLSPLVVFLSMILWGWLLGPVGALLSVPLTLMVKIFMANTNDLQWVAVLLAPARHLEEGRKSLLPPAPVLRPSKPPLPPDEEHAVVAPGE